MYIVATSTVFFYIFHVHKVFPVTIYLRGCKSFIIEDFGNFFLPSEDTFERNFLKVLYINLFFCFKSFMDPHPRCLEVKY